LSNKLLDLFCGQGGAGAGYKMAGFDVYGVDIEPQPYYPYPLHTGDALEVLDGLLVGLGVTFTNTAGDIEVLFLEQFAAVHSSPPCQSHSTITPDPSKHVDLIPDTRERLNELSQPWVIENVEGAKKALNDPIRLCGSSFGLQVRRHRYFESSVPLEPSVCDHVGQGSPVGVYGSHGDKRGAVPRPNGGNRGVKARDTEEARQVMGMPWADWYGCAQAIPPAYSEYIGKQMMKVIA
jgi:DNA (cytosine-5)-methyltransferase 1